MGPQGIVGLQFHGGHPEPSVAISSRMCRPKGDTERLDNGRICTQDWGLSYSATRKTPASLHGRDGAQGKTLVMTKVSTLASPVVEIKFKLT